MKKTHVLHVSGITVGGVGTVLKSLTATLDRKRFEQVLLLTTALSSGPHDMHYLSGMKTLTLMDAPAAPSNGPSMKISTAPGGVSAFLDRRWGKAAAQLYYFIKQLIQFFKQDLPKIPRIIRIIRQHSIDIIHTHRDVPDNKAEVLAAKLTGVPIVAHVHGLPTLWLFDRLMSRLVDSYVYISSAVARHHQHQRRNNANGVVIHNGIDIAAYCSNTSGALRTRYGLKKTDVLVGMIGRFEPWKGQRFFIEAMKDVATGCPNVKGLLIGGFNLNSGPRPGSIEFEYASSLKQLAHYHGIEDKIIFTGYLDNMPEIIADLDIVVHASCTPEPFGLVIIEAMAAGKPVVATNAGGVPDIIQDGINGTLVPMRNADAMADAILDLLADPAKVKRMGRAAQKRVADAFTHIRQAQAVQALYQRLLRRQWLSDPDHLASKLTAR